MRKEVTVQDKYIIGIDLGLTGAWALFRLVDNKIEFISVIDLPVKDGSIDVLTLAEFFYSLFSDGLSYKILIEKVHAMPQNGSKSSFSMGRTLGCIESIIKLSSLLNLSDVSCEFINPVKWKKEVGLPKGAAKELSISLAKNLFPDSSKFLTRKKDHNRAEAILIGYYGFLETLREAENVKT